MPIDVMEPSFNAFDFLDRVTREALLSDALHALFHRRQSYPDDPDTCEASACGPDTWNHPDDAETAVLAAMTELSTTGKEDSHQAQDRSVRIRVRGAIDGAAPLYLNAIETDAFTERWPTDVSILKVMVCVFRDSSLMKWSINVVIYFEIIYVVIYSEIYVVIYYIDAVIYSEIIDVVISIRRSMS